MKELGVQFDREETNVGHKDIFELSNFGMIGR